MGCRQCAAEVLRFAWIQGGQDEFCAAHEAELLAAAGFNRSYGLQCGIVDGCDGPFRDGLRADLAIAPLVSVPLSGVRCSRS
jgi:hypothetical protein